MWRIYLKENEYEAPPQLVIAGEEFYIRHRYKAMMTMPVLRRCLITMMHDSQVIEFDVVK